MEIDEGLKKAGLTGNETKVYLELLKKGELSANSLAKNLGMDRTLSYTILNHLIEKGMANFKKKEGKKYFSASEPDNLLNKIREKEAIITDLIPQLKNIKKVEDTSYDVQIFEGKEGVRTLMKEIIKTRNFSSFGGTGKAYDLLYELPAITKQFENTKAKARVIMSPEFKEHEITMYQTIETRFLDIKSEATTTIFGDCVSIHLIKDKPVVILIKNKEIAESYKNHFEFLWASARRLE